MSSLRIEKRDGRPGYLNHKGRQQDLRYQAAANLFWTSLIPGWKKYRPDAHTRATLEFFVKLVLPFTPEETGYTPEDHKALLRDFFSERRITGPEQVFLRESVGYILRSVKAQVRHEQEAQGQQQPGSGQGPLPAERPAQQGQRPRPEVAQQPLPAARGSESGPQEGVGGEPA